MSITLVLIGATGTGKTDVAFHLAKQVAGAEIVSADSRLVYRKMDIGTAKPGREMRAEVRHHMIDLVDPDRQYTCKEFETEARRIIHDILARDLIPIVVGGSGLYLRALTDGVFDGPAASEEVRERLNAEMEARGLESLWQRLKRVDPEKAVQVGQGNALRIIRALEVFELTGEKMSDLEKNVEPLDVPFVKIGLRRDAGHLYARIDVRVDRMMEEGLLEETQALMDQGYADCLAVRNTLGYRELISHLRGEMRLDEAVELIKRNTRRFAKRQGTWFRKEKGIRWVEILADARIPEVCHMVRREYHS